MAALQATLAGAGVPLPVSCRGSPPSTPSRGGSSSTSISPAQQLQQLLECVASELSQHSASVSATASKLRQAESVVKAKDDELKMLEGRFKWVLTRMCFHNQHNHTNNTKSFLLSLLMMKFTLEPTCRPIFTSLSFCLYRAQAERATNVAAQLAARCEEVAALNAKLRRKEADAAAVEGEVTRLLADYERLKTRLLQQERDGARLVAGQDTLARKVRCHELSQLHIRIECGMRVPLFRHEDCWSDWHITNLPSGTDPPRVYRLCLQVDELHGALAAKQEDCAAAVVRSAQLQEQLTAANTQLAIAQVCHIARPKWLPTLKHSIIRANQFYCCMDDLLFVFGSNISHHYCVVTGCWYTISMLRMSISTHLNMYHLARAGAFACSGASA